MLVSYSSGVITHTAALPPIPAARETIPDMFMSQEDWNKTGPPESPSDTTATHATEKKSATLLTLPIQSIVNTTASAPRNSRE